MADALSELAKEKQKKPAGEWESMSVIDRRGKTNIKVGAEGADPKHVVHGGKNAGLGSSKMGFAKGEVFGQDLDDQV